MTTGPRTTRCRALLCAEGVAQTRNGLSRAVLKVGSRMPRIIARFVTSQLDLVLSTASHSHHSAPSPGFRGRLYATRSAESGHPRCGEWAS